MRGQSNEQSLDIDLEPVSVVFNLFRSIVLRFFAFPLGLEQAVEQRGFNAIVSSRGHQTIRDNLKNNNTSKHDR